MQKGLFLQPFFIILIYRLYLTKNRINRSNGMNKIKKKLKDKLGEQRIVPLKKALKVGRIVKNVICWTLIAILAVAVVVFLVTKASGGTPTVFGYSLHRIVSGSMIPELEIGDVIVSTKVTDTSDIHMGDIITFQGGSSFDHQKVTHRVLVAPYNDGRGNTVLVTKGDANEIDDGEIDFSNVESKYLSKVTFLKDIYNFFFSPWGLIIFIILLLLIFFDEIINIVKISVHSAEQEQSEPVSDIIKRIELEQQAKTEQQTMMIILKS